MKNTYHAVIAVIVVVMLFLASNAIADKPTTPDGSVGKALGDYSTYLPIVSGGRASAPAAPTHVLYIFSTIAKTTGAAGGRTGMNTICSNEDPVSHFCTRNEIENAFLTTGVFFKSPFQKAWVDSLAMEEINNQWDVGNCLGWSSNSNIVGGENIEDHASKLGAAGNNCNYTFSVTCCKWIP